MLNLQNLKEWLKRKEKKASQIPSQSIIFRFDFYNRRVNASLLVALAIGDVSIQRIGEENSADRMKERKGERVKSVSKCARKERERRKKEKVKKILT